MPKLLPLKIKEKMIKEISSGTSINNISKKLNLGKSTIYYYYKKLKGKKYQESKFKSDLSRDEGEILGIIIGDGTIFHEKKGGHYNIYVRFGIKNKEYSIYVKNKFEKFFNKKIYLYSDCKDKLRLLIVSKKIYFYFKSFVDYEESKKYSTIKIKNIENLPKKFKLGLLKGLIDTDGTIYQTKDNRIRINFYTTSEKLKDQFITILKEFNFKYGFCIDKRKIKDVNRRTHNNNKCYSIYLWKDSITPFIKLIKPFKSNRIIGPVG